MDNLQNHYAIGYPRKVNTHPLLFLLSHALTRLVTPFRYNI